MKLVWESQAKCSALLPPPVRGTSDDQPPALAGLGHRRHLSTGEAGQWGRTTLSMSGLLGAADQKDHRPQLWCLPPPFHFSMPLFSSLKSREYECVGALRDLRSWKNSSETKVIHVPLGWQLLFPRR